MKNKIEFKKYLLKIILTSVCIIFLFLIINIYEYHKYTKKFNMKINSIVDALQDKYPNLTEKEIIEILNSEVDKEVNILKKYGINITNKSIVLENDKIYHQFLIVKIILLVIGETILTLLFIKYILKRKSNINDIIKYIEELNKKNYSLKIDSNSEDELSILKNEIYKITIMLKEVADKSYQDKVNLKKSLEDISHQLKTPLTSILIMLDNLIDEDDMDKNIREEFICEIKRNVININFLVQSILKLSKFDANTIKFVREKNLLKDILLEASKNVSPLCDLKNIKVNIKGDYNAFITCDFMWQVEALTNITKNCVEHSHLNSVIDIYYEQNNVYSIVEIKDYGEAISKKDIKHIFERFYKGENSSSDNVGIGLALAKTIIEKDNGIISVESDKKSTKFVIKYFNI